MNECIESCKRMEYWLLAWSQSLLWKILVGSCSRSACDCEKQGTRQQLWPWLVMLYNWYYLPPLTLHETIGIQFTKFNKFFLREIGRRSSNELTKSNESRRVLLTCFTTFSIVKDRHKNDAANAFCFQAIAQSMYSTFVADEKALPSTIVERSVPDDVNEWINLHAEKFPSVNTLERRLAFLCTEATTDLDAETRFHTIPMFDHGGWPRL